MSEIITLNVGGTKFETFRSTLMKSEYFVKMFEFNKDNLKPIFIDCDPDGFKCILEYLRFGNYVIPNKYQYLTAYFMIDDGVCDCSKYETIIYKGQIIKINNKKDIICTIENAITLLTMTSSKTKNKCAPSNDAYYIISLLIKEPVIQTMCFKNKKEFIEQTLLLQSHLYNGIELYNYICKNSQVSFCYTSSRDLTNDKYKFFWNPTLNIFLNYDIIIFERIYNLFVCCRTKNISKIICDYIIYFINLIKNDVDWQDIKDVIYYVSINNKVIQ